MRYFFNPNPAPAALYPLIPLLLAFGNELAIWQPNEEDIRKYLSEPFWIALSRDEIYGPRIRVLSAPYRLDQYRSAAGINRLSNAIVSLTAPSYIRPTNMKDAIYKHTQDRWAKMAPPTLARISSAMSRMAAEMETTSPDAHDGLHNVGRQTGYGFEWALFDSIVQDLAMVILSGSDAPFCKPKRWLSYVAAVDALDSKSLTTDTFSDDTEAFEAATDIVAKINTEAELLSHRQMQVDVYAARFMSFIEGISRLSFNDFKDKIEDCRADVTTFRSFERAAMSSRHLSGDLVSRAVQIQSTLNKTRDTVQRSVNTISIAIGAIAQYVSVAGHDKAARDAAGMIVGLAALPQVMVAQRPVADELAMMLLPPHLRSQPLKIALRSPDFWSSLNTEKGLL